MTYGACCFSSIHLAILSKRSHCPLVHLVFAFVHPSPTDIVSCTSFDEYRSRLLDFRLLISLTFLHIVASNTLGKVLIACDCYGLLCCCHFIHQFFSSLNDFFISINLTMNSLMMNGMMMNCDFLTFLYVFFPFFIF